MQLSKTDIHIYKEALYLRFGFNDILQANKLYLAWYFLQIQIRIHFIFMSWTSTNINIF